MEEIDNTTYCEVCGNLATVSSRINPDGYIYSKKNGGLIEYEKHYFCDIFLKLLLNNIHNRVKDIW